MNYTGEYTGPYWSDGRVQESVEWGKSTPQSELDWLSRQHDSAYAHYKDSRHREAADLLYMREAKKLAGRFPELAGNLVGYGNYTARQFGILANDAALSTKLTGNPLLGVVKYGVGGLVDSYKRVNGTYLKNELADVEKYYGTDPLKMKKPPAKEPIKLVEPKVGRGASAVALVENDGQRNAILDRGRTRNPRQGEQVVASLNASASNEQAQAQQPIAVTKPSLFQRLRRKNKKKNRVESLEDRIKRLTLEQTRLFDKHAELQKAALASKPKQKQRALGINREDAIRIKVKEKQCNKNIC